MRCQLSLTADVNQVDMYDVIVIGGGMAGVTAARELDNAGLDYLVLEARDRYGGRLLTDSETGFELGAAWLHEVPHNPLEAIVEKTPGVSAEYDDEKVALLFPDGSPLNAGSVIPDFNSWRKAKPDMSLEAAAHEYASHLDSRDARSILSFAGVPQLPLGLTWDKLSAAAATNDPGRDKAVLGGYLNVLKYIAGPVLSKIKYGEVVTTISQGEAGVCVRTKDDEYMAKKAIVTIPAAVLRAGDVKFEPPLPESLTGALQNTKASAVGKVYLTFPENFWDPTFDKFIITGPSPALVWNFSSVHPGTTPNTLCILIGNELIRSVEADPAQAFKLVRPYLEAVKLPERSVLDPIKVITTTWLSDPFSKGAYSTFELGADRADAVRAWNSGHGLLSFAGEHTTLDGPTFLHGAWLSGKRAGEQCTL